MFAKEHDSPSRFVVDWREAVVCPECKGDLREIGTNLLCRACGRGYPVLPGDIPSFVNPTKVNS